MSWSSLRRRTWEIVEVARPGDRASRLFDIGIRVLIALNVLAVIVETVPDVNAVAGPWLLAFDVASVVVFSVEYALRVWSSVEDDRYAAPVRGRLRFARTPLALVDLLAVLPFWLPILGLDLRVLRAVRLFRLFRILKIARYSKGLRTFGRVFHRKKEDLVLTLALVAFLLVMASSLLYYVENAAQPEVFSSIPAAMWWGVVTLTTVGYGDVYPVTLAGRIMGGFFALSALLLVALPTAILGAAFVDELESGRRGADADGEAGPAVPPARCPHCGELLRE